MSEDSNPTSENDPCGFQTVTVPQPKISDGPKDLKNVLLHGFGMLSVFDWMKEQPETSLMWRHLRGNRIDKFEGFDGPKVVCQLIADGMTYKARYEHVMKMLKDQKQLMTEIGDLCKVVLNGETPPVAGQPAAASDQCFVTSQQ